MPAASTAMPGTDAREPNVANRLTTHCTLNAAADQSCTDTFESRILREAGRDELSRFDFPHMADEPLTIENAIVVSPAGQITPVGEAMIEVHDGAMPASGFARSRQTSIVFPDLQVGSTVKFTRHYMTRNRSAPGRFHAVFYIDTTGARFDHHDLTFSAPQGLRWKSADMEGFTINGSADGRQLQVTLDQPRFTPTINAGGTERLHRQPRFEIADTQPPETAFEWFAERFNPVIDAPLPPKAALFIQLLRATGEKARVTEIMRYIQAEYRYFGDWRPNERGYQPFPLATIERNGYGDCKDLSVLLVAMLNAAGVKHSRIAFVHRGIVDSPTLFARPGAINHAVVQVDVEGTSWWLDPTNPVFQPGNIPADIQARFAYVLDIGGSRPDKRQVWIPAALPESITTDGTLTVRSDGSGEVAVTGVLRHHSWTTQLAQWERTNGPNAVDGLFCEDMDGNSCKVERSALGFVVPTEYRYKLFFSERNALTPTGRHFIYQDKTLDDLVGELNFRQRTTRGIDAMVGETGIQQDRVLIANAFIEGAAASCTADSRWFRIETSLTPMPPQTQTPIATKRGVIASRTIETKARWLDEDELQSEAFKTFLIEATQCAALLREPLQIVPQ